MNSSFYNGISGIKSHQFGMDIVANNISNISTIGFKGSTPEYSSHFSSVLSDSYFEGTINDIGHGSKASGTQLDMSQGIFQFTDNVFDLALGGEGWFGVQSVENETLYTRAGSFSIDTNGDMVDANGNYLLGTAGGNITPTTLSTELMEQFGRYYGKDSSQLGEANQITSVTDITLGSVEGQTKINLPDILYFPPEATTNVSYSANLDPKIIISATQIDLDSADVVQNPVNIPNQTLTINGTVSNTTELQNPKEADVVLVTITDVDGKTVEARTSLDSNLNWLVTNQDVSSLNTASPLVTTAKLQTTQEIPNVEHFSSTIISPTGEKDVLDMTYTKRVPQPALGSIWDGVIQVLSFYEKYDPSKTYDPTQYKIDEPAGKVYEIIDQQNAVVEFAGSGALLSSAIPSISNSGTPLTIDVGQPNSFTGFVSNVDLDRSRSETHDGYIAGLLKQYGMDGNGNVVAEFDNGRSTPVAKVAVYHFQNDQGLESVGSTMFKYSANSGKPIFYTNESGENIIGSQIFANRLESSNVSFATALTELIIMQKAFDASSKSITTSDQMIQNAINMKS
jgi:flagellar hook protein FlgE